MGRRKRGLPIANIQIWLYIKITSKETKDVIFAEIPDAVFDKVLHEIAMKNMIHGL